MSVCVSVKLSVYVSVAGLCKNSLDEFDIANCPIKVNFLRLPLYKLSSPIHCILIQRKPPVRPRE